MYTRVLLQVVLELERLGAVLTLEATQLFTLLVTQHVTLQTIDVGERLTTHTTYLRHNTNVELHSCL